MTSLTEPSYQRPASEVRLLEDLRELLDSAREAQRKDDGRIVIEVRTDRPTLSHLLIQLDELLRNT